MGCSYCVVRKRGVSVMQAIELGSAANVPQLDIPALSSSSSEFLIRANVVASVPNVARDRVCFRPPVVSL